MSGAAIEKLLTDKSRWILSHLNSLPASQEPAMEADELLQLTKMAKQIIPPRVAHFAKLMNISYGRVTIRHQKTHWGSCSSAGNLNFNCLLLLAPEEILDYVIVHELSHRKEMNHSPAFWANVEAVLPDYKCRKAWLKNEGSSLIARLPK